MGDYNEGVYILIEGRQVERFTVTVVIDGERKTYPGAFELREALDRSNLLQKMLMLPSERVLVAAKRLANVLPLDRQRLKRAMKGSGIRV